MVWLGRAHLDPGPGGRSRRTGSARFLAAAEPPLAGRRPCSGWRPTRSPRMIGRATLAAAGMAGRAGITLGDYRSLRLAVARMAPPCSWATRRTCATTRSRRGGRAGCVIAAARQGLAASGLAGLHVHFFLATALHAVPGDAGVLVTAAEWLDVNYGSLVRSLLLGPLGGESVHLLDPAVPAFADAAATTAITCFRRAAAPPACGCAGWPGSPTWASWRADGGARPGPARRVPLDPAGGRGRLRPLSGAAAPARWPRRARGAVPGPPRPGDRRQQGLGHGRRTRLTRPAGSCSRRSPAPASCSAPGTRWRRPRGCGSVIDLPADLAELAPGRARAGHPVPGRGRGGRGGGSYIARHRTPWWRVRLRAPAPILATYMARRPPAFVRNLAGARHVNIAHGLYPREPLPLDRLDGLAAYLRRSVTRGRGALYAGGLTKFEPGEMERLPVPAPDLLPAYAPETAAGPGATAEDACAP